MLVVFQPSGCAKLPELILPSDHAAKRLFPFAITRIPVIASAHVSLLSSSSLTHILSFFFLFPPFYYALYRNSLEC